MVGNMVELLMFVAAIQVYVADDTSPAPFVAALLGLHT